MQDIISKKSIGERLRTLRLAKDLSQAEISDILGLSRSHYSQVELGKQFPSYQVLSRASTFYNKDYAWILHGNDMEAVIANVKDVLTEEMQNEPSIEFSLNSQVGAVAPDSSTVLVRLNEYVTYEDRRQEQDYIKSLPAVSLPFAQLPDGSYRAFEVPGDEMEPVFYQQDIAIASLVSDHSKVILSNPYVIVSSKGISLRRVVSLSLKDSALVTIGDNKRYGSEILKLEHVYELWEVKAKVSFRLNKTINSISQYFHDFESTINALKQEVGELKQRAADVV
jgi:transcriptional regulator with XRE-family HTH domain